MSYNAVVEMVGSVGLRNRIAACAADEGLVGDPVAWAMTNAWQVVSQSDWIAAWDSAQANSSLNWNPDTGLRDDVITDGMILAVVQPMLTSEPPAA